LEDAGVGALRREFERLKAKLAAEGLFALERKRGLPRFPRRIGVITSPSGAALRDILHILARRFPPAPVLIYPTAVQGAAAAPALVAALEIASGRAEVDVLILARGGGSLEDLWAYNDERVARAIYASRLPIVSGVGHEIDFTIADFVADARAPTPSAAAELVAPARAPRARASPPAAGSALEAPARDARVRSARGAPPGARAARAECRESACHAHARLRDRDARCGRQLAHERRDGRRRRGDRGAPRPRAPQCARHGPQRGELAWLPALCRGGPGDAGSAARRSSPPLWRRVSLRVRRRRRRRSCLGKSRFPAASHSSVSAR